MVSETLLSGVNNQLMRPGAVGIIPTDTVYGLVARAEDQAAVQRLYELKKRDAKPGTIIAASIEQLEALGLKRRYLTAVQDFWPGALSVVIPCGPALSWLHQGKFSLAVRVPKHAPLQALLAETGPLLTSSANQPGEPISTTIAQAKKYFKDQVDFYIDGGDMANHKPSTIIRIVDDEIEVLREGAVVVTQEGRTDDIQ